MGDRLSWYLIYVGVGILAGLAAAAGIIALLHFVILPWLGVRTAPAPYAPLTPQEQVEVLSQLRAASSSDEELTAQEQWEQDQAKVRALQQLKPAEPQAQEETKQEQIQTLQGLQAQ